MGLLSLGRSMNMLNVFFDEAYFSAETVADVLSISKKNVESWAKNGKLVPALDPTAHDKPYSKEQLKVFPQIANKFNSTWDDDMAVVPKREYTLVELFAGAGGLALGLEQAVFKSVLLN